MKQPVLALMGCGLLSLTGCGSGGGGAPVEPSVVLLAPHGGETWAVGSARVVTWSSAGFAGSVDIEYSTDSGVTWIAWIANTPNDGTADVVVPNALSATVRVQVSAADGDPLVALAPSDVSDADCAIVAPFRDIVAGLPGLGSFRGGTTLAWGDFDNDGDLDLALAGYAESPIDAAITRIYRNDGGSAFVDIAAGLPGLARFDSEPSLAWGDFDNDGDLDLALAGFADSPINTGITRIYRNNGVGGFVDIVASLPGIGRPTPEGSPTALEWGDFDNDGDLDLALAGLDNSFGGIARVYRNDGGGAFVDGAVGLPALEVFGGSVALDWGDFDNDGDLDLALAGLDAVTFQGFVRVYRNDGGGSFVDGAVGLPALADFEGSAALDWGDFDNDGDLDLALAGRDQATFTEFTRVYRNDGGGLFVDIVAGLPGIAGFGGPFGNSQSDLAWGDFDNDGDLDLAMGGFSESVFAGITRVYRNDGGGVFVDSEAGLPSLGGFEGGVSMGWGDFDNDGDLDLALVGFDEATFSGITRIYRNELALPNTLPLAVTQLQALTGGAEVLLTWNTATDAETPVEGLTYNLRIGQSPGGNEVRPSMAGIGGQRRLPAMGATLHDPAFGWAWLELPPGIYFASVQAIDSAFAGGPWTAPVAFIISGGPR